MWAVADHYLFLSMKDDNVKFLLKTAGGQTLIEDLMNRKMSPVDVAKMFSGKK